MRKPLDDREIIQKAYLETNAFYKGKKDWVTPVTLAETRRVITFYFTYMFRHMRERKKRLLYIPHFGYIYYNRWRADKYDEAIDRAQKMGFKDIHEKRAFYENRQKEKDLNYLRKKYANQ